MSRTTVDLVLTDEQIEEAFKGTRFGGTEQTDAGRRGLLVECILKIASGFSAGSTITRICADFELLGSADGAPREKGIRWVFHQLYNSNGLNVMERLARRATVVVPAETVVVCVGCEGETPVEETVETTPPGYRYCLTCASCAKRKA